jgi:hypothetical protein
MKPSLRTWALLALALLLVLANLWVRRGRQAEAPPTVAAVPADQARRIELSDSIEKVVLEPSPEGGWRIVAPVSAPADMPTVEALLEVFAEPLTMDVRVDEGNLDTYGLEPGKGMVVELWAQGEEPVASLTVGLDAPGGSSFVRLSGSEAIYRARVGGRERYSANVSHWRNRDLLRFERQEVVSMRWEQDQREPILLERPPVGLDQLGPWALEPAAPWPLDQAFLDATVDRLVGMRAEEVLTADFAGGFEPPVVRVRFQLRDGRTPVLELGRRAHAEAAFVRIEGEDAVFRVPRRDILALLAEREDLRERKLLSFAPEDLDTMTWEEGGRQVIVRQLPAEGRWEALSPAGRDLDVERLNLVVRGLAELRGDRVLDGLSPGAAGLSPPGASLVLTMIDGRSLALDIGAPLPDRTESPARAVRASGRPEVMELRELLIDRLRASFPDP